MIPEWLRRWRTENPLAALALAAAAGLMTVDWLHLQPGPGWAVLCLIAVGQACWRPAFWKAVLAVGFGFAFWHSIRLAETYDHPLRQRLLAHPAPGARVSVQARLFPWVDGVELDAARAGGSIAAVRWDGAAEFAPMRAEVKVVLPPGITLDQPGLYELEGDLSLPRAPMSPGQFDGAGYSLRMGWVAVLKAETCQRVAAEAWAPKFHLLHWAEASRQWILRALSLGIEADERGKAVVLAMALGASSAAGDDVESAFRNSGTLHVFAVSGLHVVMVAAVAGFVLRWLGVSRHRAAWLLIVFVFFYAYVTGWRPSAARAALMIGFVLGAPLLNRQTALQNSLGAAALALFALDTHQFFTPGFQLSFGVLWAIAIGASWLLERTRPWTDLDPFLPPVLAGRRQRGGEWARRQAASLGSVSTAAWSGSVPLVLGHFQTITPVAILANCVLVPMSSFCITFACLSLCCAALRFSLGQVLLNQLNALLAHGMVACAAWFSSLPMATLNVDLDWQNRAPVEMRVFQFPGGGGAGHIRTATSHWLLDCGNGSAWRHVISPYLRSEGVNQLQGLILTHGDAGHVGAAPELLKVMNVRELHTSTLEPWRYDPPFSSLRQLSRLAPPGAGIWRRHSVHEQILLGQGAVATILFPQPGDIHEKADDRGLVLLLQMHGVRVLWLGDAGFITEKKLLEREAPLRCDVLIRHQHSADVSGLTELLLAAQPQAIISSNDAWQAEERMPERVRYFCSAAGVTLFDMAACGSVALRFRGGAAEIEAFTNGQRATVKPPPEGAPPADR